VIVGWDTEYVERVALDGVQYNEILSYSLVLSGTTVRHIGWLRTFSILPRLASVCDWPGLSAWPYVPVALAIGVQQRIGCSSWLILGWRSGQRCVTAYR
jgi:hypothetical protein